MLGTAGSSIITRTHVNFCIPAISSFLPSRAHFREIGNLDHSLQRPEKVSPIKLVVCNASDLPPHSFAFLLRNIRLHKSLRNIFAELVLSVYPQLSLPTSVQNKSHHHGAT
ncbi:hypothetical protein EYC80_006185 [Monilinia laxa]|uniref:Uncharacterized protein n=1 Tax=Monilinia laxa TaxID=61186 RepID=A0A5N6KHZ2_MONLA|nr:hypothetical protein EYC80_006185 [Monilinia laxa]